VVRGRFDTGHQFLLDNRVHREQAGYHVITPLHIEGSDMRVLVNRGWIPALASHSEQPRVVTPTGIVELHGVAVVPGSRFFTLGNEPAGSAWQGVWQNLDLARFASLVSWPVQPVVLQLAPEAPAGFAREWPRPDDRLERHLSYAYQWYGFAASAVLIWFALGWRRA
jgi:surfeit locus 1 family protein